MISYKRRKTVRRFPEWSQILICGGTRIVAEQGSPIKARKNSSKEQWQQIICINFGCFYRAVSVASSKLLERPGDSAILPGRVIIMRTQVVVHGLRHDDELLGLAQSSHALNKLYNCTILPMHNFPTF